MSRNHFNFVKKKNKLYIIDKGSKFGTLIYLNNPMYITPKKNEGTIISGKHWFSINLQQNQSFFGKLFGFKCCGCGQIKQDADIDVEGLLDNIGDNNKNNCKPKIDLSNNEEDGDDNDKFPIIDELYQDYILDLGDSIYLHKNTEIEDMKLIDKINK